MATRPLPLAVLLVGLLVRPAAAGPPEPLATAAVDSFAREHGREDYLVIDRWGSTRVRTAGSGLDLDEESLTDYLVLRAAGAATVGSVSLTESPATRVLDLRVELWREGSRTARYSRGDLEWREQRSRGNARYVVLDGTDHFAAVPGLQAGDRLRVYRRTVRRGVHALAPASVGAYSAPTFRSTRSWSIDDDIEARFVLRGPEELVDRIERSPGRRGEMQFRLGPVSLRRQETLGRGEPVSNVLIFPQLMPAGGGRVQRGKLALVRDWREAGDAYLELLGDRLEPSEEIVAIVRELGADRGAPMERIQKIYAHVQASCRYLGFYLAEHGILPPRPEEVARLGHGDCKGLGILLAALLRAADLPADPVLVLAGWAGPLEPDAPSLGQFNHFIVHVGVGEGLFLDPTITDCPVGQLPYTDCRWPVLLVQPGRSRLVEIPRTTWDPGRASLSLRGRLGPQGQLAFELEGTLDGERAYGLRRFLSAGDLGERRAFVSESYLEPSLQPQANVVELVEGGGRLEARLRFVARGRSARSVTRAAGEWYLPLSLVQPPGRPFWERERRDPVDLPRLGPEQQRWALQLPPGLTLASPDTLHIEREGLYWSRRTWQQGDSLFVEREVRWGPDPLPADQAPAFLADLDRALAAERGWVVLREQEPAGP